MSHTRKFFSDFQAQQDRIFIRGEEFYHLKRVLRVKANDPVEVINDCILKTETAALSIAAIVKNLNQGRPV